MDRFNNVFNGPEEGDGVGTKCLFSFSLYCHVAVINSIRVHWESEMFFLTQEYAVSSCKRCVALLSDPDGGIITVRIWLQVLSVFTQLLVLSFLLACLTVTSLLMSFQVICCFHIHPISQYVHFHCLVSAPHYFIYNPCLKWSPVTE